MDVNVRDVDEIVRFGNSLKSFLSDYLGALMQVVQSANIDYTTARNALTRIRTKMEAAERELRSAEFSLENVERDADNNPEEDYSRELAFRAEMVEEKRAIYEQAKQAFEEAETLVKRVKTNTDMVIEQIYRSRNIIRDNGNDALQSIAKSARAISNYIKK